MTINCPACLSEDYESDISRPLDVDGRVCYNIIEEQLECMDCSTVWRRIYHFSHEEDE